MDRGGKDRAGRAIDWLDVVAFAVELAALLFWGLWAWRQGGTALGRMALTLLALGVFVALWALLFAPTAAKRLRLPWLFVGKLILLLTPGILALQTALWQPLLWAALVLGYLALATARARL